MDRTVKLMLSLTDKTILILGASSDIGLSLLDLLEPLGAKIICQAHTNGSKIPKKFNPISYRFTDEHSVHTFFEKNVPNEIHGCVNLIGKTGFTFSKYMTTEELNEIMFLNLNINFFVAKELHHFLSDEASVVFISSAVGDIAENGMSHYAVSKSGLESLTRSLAKEFSYKRVRVNCVSPHLIETVKTKKIPQNIKQGYIDNNLLKRLGKPEDVAHTILFLLSSMSAYITGQTIRVNGGSYF